MTESDPYSAMRERVHLSIARGKRGIRDEEAQVFASCLSTCRDWFGEPVRPGFGVVLLRGRDVRAAPDPLFRVYAVALPVSDANAAGFCDDCGHAAFAVCCRGRRTAVRWRHIYDMLATRAVAKLLVTPWVLEFCATRGDDTRPALEQATEHARSWLAHADMDQLGQRVRSWWSRRQMHPSEYGAAIWLLAEALEAHVGWLAMCALSRYRSFDAWREALPGALRSGVPEL